MADFRQGGTKRFSGGHGGHGGGFGGRGGRPSFGGGNRGGFRGGDRDRGPVTMHKAICNECGKPCEVPFVPTQGKPVFCKDCFSGKKEMGGNDRGASRPSFGGDRFPKKDFGVYKTPPRTDFGNDVPKVTGEDIKRQLESLNSKMERLINLLEGPKTAKIVASEVNEIKEAKIEKVKKVVKAKKVSKK